jgi:hypothetical protein
VHYDDNIGCLLPHLSRLKALEQYIKLRAAVLLESGRRAEAFEDLQLMFRLADTIRDEPFLITHQVRMACLALSLQVVKEGLVRHGWTADQVVWIQNRCAGINLVREGEIHVKGERALGLECIELVRRRVLPVNAMYGEDGESAKGQFFRTALHLLAPSGWYSQNMLSLCQFHERYLRDSVDSNSPRVNAGALKKIENEMEHTPRTPFNVIGKLLSPSMEGYWLRTARWQTALDHVTVACALERQHLQTGRYPDTLQALVPVYTEKLPKDVISGAPIRYRLENDKNYILYSPGWNERDDGGIVAALSVTGPDTRKGDWVWSLTPTEPVKLH